MKNGWFDLGNMFSQPCRTTLDIPQELRPITAPTTSDGSTADYYQLPAGATQLRDLIQHRNMNHADGEIFCAIYRKGHCSHSSRLREAKKVLSYAQAEVARLEKYGEVAK